MSEKQAAQNKLPIAILISGNGSNLQAFIDQIKNNNLHAEIRVVISNKAEAFGLKRAEQASIPTEIITALPGETREDYDQRLIQILNHYNPAFIILAGFMRILSPAFITHFPNRVLNIHPSLLPHYRGTQTHERVLVAKEKLHGTTVHIVTEKLDDGPILGQAFCPILNDDTPDSLKQKVQKLEHQLYPKVIDLIATGQLTIERDQVLLNGKPIASPITCET